MTRGTTPDPFAVITALRANNDVLRRELFSALAARTFWRKTAIAAIVFGAVGFWACAALTMWEGM